MHAIKVERERESLILIHSGKAKRMRGRNKTKEFCPRMKSGVASTLWIEVVAG